MGADRPTAQASPSTPELHLPDLPQLQLGGSTGEGRARRPRRGLREWLTVSLPLLLMALLALGTWWLVQVAPQPPAPRPPSTPGDEPDYRMQQFTITRFSPQGRQILRLEGRVLRHFPATDRLEIDDVRIEAEAPDGRRTEARARRAVSNGDGTEISLEGTVRLRSAPAAGAADAAVTEFEGESLQAWTRFQRLHSDRPLQLRHGTLQVRAGSMSLDKPAGTLTLGGPVRLTAPPRGTAG